MKEFIKKYEAIMVITLPFILYLFIVFIGKDTESLCSIIVGAVAKTLILRFIGGLGSMLFLIFMIHSSSDFDKSGIIKKTKYLLYPAIVGSFFLFCYYNPSIFDYLNSYYGCLYGKI